jgi:hypothetical protein
LFAVPFCSSIFAVQKSKDYEFGKYFDSGIIQYKISHHPGRYGMVQWLASCFGG